ncbi:MAG: hypothetical protein JSS02_13655 [Planctomycetes bacterium]|nr:hypothetical protein [Planctomycetota bacterium]
MPEFTCPECHAAIAPDLLESTGAAVCPFCDADLSALDLPGPPEPRDRDEAATATTNIANGSPARSRHPLPPLPQDSLIRVEVADPERMVLYIPGGGASSGGLGFFAVIWNGFMVVFTTLMVLGVAKGQQAQAPPILGIVAFFTLFWGVGLGMGYAWLRMKYQRTFLLIERSRIVVQRVLFGHKRVLETALNAESRAVLVEAYSQNEVPVYRVEVPGSPRAARFGTALSEREKEWLVDRINDFLSPSSAAAPSAATKPRPGPPAAASSVGQDDRITHLAARDLPADSLIEVVIDEPEQLQIRMPVAPSNLVKWFMVGFCTLFCLIWFGVALHGLVTRGLPRGGMAIVAELVHALPMLVTGLFPLGLGLLALGGSISIDVTRSFLSCRWAVGPFGWTKRLPTPEITHLSGEPDTVRSGGRTRIRTTANSQNQYQVWAGDKSLLLTLLHDDTVGVQVAALVRTKLEELGCSLREP